jgi:hypothetical protein
MAGTDMDMPTGSASRSPPEGMGMDMPTGSASRCPAALHKPASRSPVRSGSPAATPGSAPNRTSRARIPVAQRPPRPAHSQAAGGPGPAGTFRASGPSPGRRVVSARTTVRPRPEAMQRRRAAIWLCPGAPIGVVPWEEAPPGRWPCRRACRAGSEPWVSRRSVGSQAAAAFRATVASWSVGGWRPRRPGSRPAAGRPSSGGLLVNPRLGRQRPATDSPGTIPLAGRGTTLPPEPTAGAGTGA